ncbi:MAG: SIMPL domain-containing protein [Verrucomicrobia bacterium]|nr:MAG: SIMPL domain-containing protein [Verrucomicrobiota bacterium]
MNPAPRPHLFGMLAGLFLATGLLFSSALATSAWLKIRNSQLITVKGSARKNITSDLAIWRGAFTVEASTLLDAQRRLRADAAKVEQFLTAQSVTNFSFTPITIEELTATISNTNNTYIRKETAGYRLTQSVRVETGDVTQIARLDSGCVRLVEEGVLFTAQSPEFIYTKAGEAKIEMLAEAAKDARTRAEQIASQGGRALAQMHDADMGVIQITPPYSGQTSWEGMNDTSSLNKTITAVVTATFALK